MGGLNALVGLASGYLSLVAELDAAVDVGEAGELTVDAGDALDLALGGEALVEAVTRNCLTWSVQVRKKQAPKEYPIESELAEILKQHRMRMLKEQAPGLEKGLMFPSKVGTYRTPNTLDIAWAKCLEHAGIDKRFTPHGLRYTFTDLVRRANVDAVVRRALTGHVTEEMQRHYSTVGIDEKRAAIAGVLRLVPMGSGPTSPTQSGSFGGSLPENQGSGGSTASCVNLQLAVTTKDC